MPLNQHGVWTDGKQLSPEDPVTETEKDRLLKEIMFTLRQFDIPMLAEAMRHLRLLPYMKRKLKQCQKD